MRVALVRRRRIGVGVLLALLVLVTTWHYWALYSSITGAKSDLEGARLHLRDAGLNLTANDIVQARRDVRSARGNVSSSRRQIRWDPFLRLAGVVPGAKDQVSAMDDILDMADLLIDIGDSAADAGDKAVAYRDRPPEGQPLTKSLIDLLNEAGPELDRINALSDQLVAKRIAMGDKPLLPPLNSARERLDEELPRVANAVDQAELSKDLLPAFLGFEGDRRYMLFALNSGELLPGGGLVTSAGIMPVSEGINGSLDFIDSTGWKAAWERKGGNYIEPPGPLKRYLLRDFTWNLLVSNWSPDFPAWSQQAREFYELVNGKQRIDGIIAVDLTVLERLLSVTGPKTLDIQGFGQVTFTSDNAVLQLEALTRQSFDPGEDRKSVIGQLAEQLLADMLRLPSDKWASAVDIIRDLGAERHIQVLSYQPAEQTVIRDFGWDGAIKQDKTDYLELNEASVLSTKLNLIIKPEGVYNIDLNGLGEANHELRLTYRNPFSEWAADKHPDLVSQLMLQGLYGGYLRVFGPSSLSNYSAEIDGAPASIEDTGSEAGRDWFGTLLTVPPDSTREVVFRWKVAVTTKQDEYDLLIQKQPGTDGICLALAVTRNGKAPAALDITGGTRDQSGRVCLTTDVRVRARF
ncbi:MAG: DUF4012 domain-containing protein [Chloroflexi bacterium]|nr:DUF4012 domain-containing protein [Chloroflexota bacterium]